MLLFRTVRFPVRRRDWRKAHRRNLAVDLDLLFKLTVILICFGSIDLACAHIQRAIDFPGSPTSDLFKQTVDGTLSGGQRLSCSCSALLTVDIQLAELEFGI